MAEGHHFVPIAVLRELAAKLTAAADRVFRKAVTGNPFTEDHRWSREHQEYNRRVGILLKGYITNLGEHGKLEKGKLTDAQAEYFVAQIKKDGFGDKTVFDFNQKVLKMLRVIALAGIAAAGLSQVEKVRAFEQNQKLKNYYKTAVAALRKGDWKTANAAIRGGGGFGSQGNNLIDELTKAGYYREAAILDDQWKKRLNDLRAVESGHAVQGVPNTFEAFAPQ